MTLPMRHTWLGRSLAVFAVAALLFTVGSHIASAKPAQQQTERDLDKALCDMMGGDWWEYGSDYTCYFDDWYLVCENDGTDCQIFCDLGKRCERIVDEARRQASLADSQKVVEPVPTATPPIRGRGRSTTADEPMVVAPLATPGPAPIVIIESPGFDSTPVMIDPARN